MGNTKMSEHYEYMYEQESRDIERAINTLKKMEVANINQCSQTFSSSITQTDEPKVDQKAVVLEYLENAYSGAKMMDDVGMMHRLSRAILAFVYDGPNNSPTWEEMQEFYIDMR